MTHIRNLGTRLILDDIEYFPKTTTETKKKLE